MLCFAGSLPGRPAALLWEQSLAPAAFAPEKQAVQALPAQADAAPCILP